MILTALYRLCHNSLSRFMRFYRSKHIVYCLYTSIMILKYVGSTFAQNFNVISKNANSVLFRKFPEFFIWFVDKMKEKSIAEKGNQFTSCSYNTSVYKERYIRNSSKKLKIAEKFYRIFVICFLQSIFNNLRCLEWKSRSLLFYLDKRKIIIFWSIIWQLTSDASLWRGFLIGPYKNAENS